MNQLKLFVANSNLPLPCPLLGRRVKIEVQNESLVANRTFPAIQEVVHDVTGGGVVE